jgi:hypothetical protein
MGVSTAGVIEAGCVLKASHAVPAQTSSGFHQLNTPTMKELSGSPGGSLFFASSR